jgi:hypothetical protein
MIVTIAAAALAAHLGAAPVGDINSLVHQVRRRWCSHGYDIDVQGTLLSQWRDSPSVSGRATI